jgi:5-oxoprolinase (ATP-hydrolysing) subunit A
MTVAVNLNADLGESFGDYTLGNDDDILKVIKSASIACGFHGGDFRTMHDVVLRAKQQGVSIGCHPGYNDLWGFGRRRIDMRPDDVEYMVAYQIGALAAMAAYVGEKVSHLKPHGSLYNLAAEDADCATAIGRAIKTVDRDIIYVALAGSQMETQGRKLGLRVAREGFCDRQYEDDGNLTSRKLATAVHRDPAVAARQTVHMVLHGEVISRTGRAVPRRVETLCVHGDEPTGVAVAQAVRNALEAAGVKVVPLPEMTFD